MKKYLLLLVFLFQFCGVFAQSTPPKREFRAVWFTTVSNSDWPVQSAGSISQMTNMKDLFDRLKALGVNVIIMQVRTSCDAFFQSPYEPWSYYLTGTQGKVPNPFYDPLQFACEEAHKRGMELHAWFNPYRVQTGTSYSLASNYISYQHPEWVLTIEGGKILDPGLPQVRDYVVKIITDVVRRYDVDGIHMDDFFYPYPNPTGITTQDDSTFIKYPRGFTNRADWRRDNVNLLIKGINDSAHIVKPYVKFGMSPFGIWKSGTPTGITGLSSYSDIFCDPIAWMQKQSVDYLTPQLYWKITGSQDYSKLSAWWADSVTAHTRHFYPGLAPYRINSGTSPFTASEIPSQIRINRSNTKIKGEVFFRTMSVLDNPLGFADTLKNDLYRYPALRPVMSWKDAVPPNPPLNVRYERTAGTGVASLVWDKPATASDGDSANMFVVYKFGSSTITQADIDNPANIESILNSRSYNFSKTYTQLPVYFAVTSVDRNSNESTVSNAIQMTVPQTPVPALPLSGAVNQKDTTLLSWYYPALAASYSVQVGTDSTFATGLLLNRTGVYDTVTSVTGMTGQTKYFWRVRAFNPVGQSEYSEVYSFTAGAPNLAVMAFPAKSAQGVTTSPLFKWYKQPEAASYRLQLASGLISPSTIILDTVVTDTSLQVRNLADFSIYFWRVQAQNQYGIAAWPEQWGFKTAAVGVHDLSSGIPSEFSLSQNYPNPFNPETGINFSLPKDANVNLTVYDILGRKVEILLDDYKPAGTYRVTFNASGLTSGVYFYELRSGNFRAVKKFTLMK